MLQSLQTTWKNLGTGSPEAQGQAWLRLLVGGFFVWQGQSVMENPQLLIAGRLQLLAWAAHHPLPWVQGFILKGLAPNWHWMVNVLTDTMVLMGVSWITGLGTGLSSLILLMASGVLLLLAQPISPEMIWICGLMASVGFSLYKGSGQLQGLLRKGLSWTHWRAPSVRLNGRKVAHQSTKPKRREPSISKKDLQDVRAYNRAATSRAEQAGTLKSLKPKPVSLSVVPSKRTESKARAGKVRRLEKVLKQQAKRFETKASEATPQTDANPVALHPTTNQEKPSADRFKPKSKPEDRDVMKEEAPVAEELKVVKIFDHRSPDEDD